MCIELRTKFDPLLAVHVEGFAERGSGNIFFEYRILSLRDAKYEKHRKSLCYFERI